MTCSTAQRSMLLPPPPDQDEADELAEALAGRLQLIRLLWAGPYSNLYLARPAARSEGPASQVRQVKVLSRKAASDAGLLQLFNLEAEAARKLDHWNIARTRDAEQINGWHVVQTEAIENSTTLRDLMTRQAWLEPMRAIAIAVQAAGALAYAHARGVLHLNLVPETILLRPDGTALLSGFGIDAGRQFAAAHRARSTALPFQYMSPEQTLASEIDYRSDIYTLGTIFFEMLTDRLPFDPASKPIAEMPLPPRLLFSSIPEQLSHLVVSLLAPEPGRRISSIDELRVSLVDMLKPVASAVGIEPAFEVNRRTEPPEPTPLEPDSIEIDMDELLADSLSSIVLSNPAQGATQATLESITPIPAANAASDLMHAESKSSGFVPADSAASDAPASETPELLTGEGALVLPNDTPAAEFAEPYFRPNGLAGGLLEAVEIESRRRERVAMLVLAAIVIAALLIIALFAFPGHIRPAAVSAEGASPPYVDSSSQAGTDRSETKPVLTESNPAATETKPAPPESNPAAQSSDPSAPHSESATVSRADETSQASQDESASASQTEPPAEAQDNPASASQSQAPGGSQADAPAETKSESTPGSTGAPATPASQVPARRTYRATRIADARPNRWSRKPARTQSRRRRDPMRHLRDVKKFFYW